MDSVIDDFKAKNFDLEIHSDLYAVNQGLDFSGFLDVNQALGARMLVETLRDLDDNGIESWTIHGWYPRCDFGEDHNGVMDDTSFINEAFLCNEVKMDDLWYNMPCLSIRKGKGVDAVWIGVDDAPYVRHAIMEPVIMKDMTIRNDDSFPFPGEDAVITVSDDRYRTEHGTPYKLRFRMPEAFCIRYDDGDERKQTWRFITGEDREKMRAELHEMEREYWDDRRRRENE